MHSSDHYSHTGRNIPGLIHHIGKQRPIQNIEKPIIIQVNTLVLFGWPWKRQLLEVFQFMGAKMKVTGIVELFFWCLCFGQVVNIPDANFKAFLVTNYDTSHDGEISPVEAEAVTGLMDCGNLGLVDLTGISAFINLERLYCGNNQLTSLPNLSSLTNLERLYCYSNQLTSLPDLSSLTNLEWLYCCYNQLTSLPDLTALTNLEKLSCCLNQLTSLPYLNALTNLETLDCVANQLTSLPDLVALINLRVLYCSNNLLTNLPDLSALTNLTWLYCVSNQRHVSEIFRHQALSCLK